MPSWSIGGAGQIVNWPILVAGSGIRAPAIHNLRTVGLSNNSTSISTNVATVIGAAYEVTFDHSILSVVGDASIVTTFDVAITGQADTSYSNSFLDFTLANGVPNGFLTESIQFTATASTTTLSFVSTALNGVGDRGPTIDNVRFDLVVPPIDITDPTDSEPDGMGDNWEEFYFGDLSRDGTLDYDNDGRSDLQEWQDKTNPIVADTDDDGLTDGQEAALGTDPLDAHSDDDDWSDGEEVAAGRSRRGPIRTTRTACRHRRRTRTPTPAFPLQRAMRSSCSTRSTTTLMETIPPWSTSNCTTSSPPMSISRTGGSMATPTSTSLRGR